MSVLQRSKSQIYGLTAELAQIVNDAAAEALARAAGDTALTNSLDSSVTALSDLISQTNQLSLKKADNLSDLADVAVARTNLSVDSKAEVDAKINAAKLALGTNLVFDNYDAFDSTPTSEFSVGDVVFLKNNIETDGDWSFYLVSEVTANSRALEPLSTKAQFLASQSAGAIKAAYESNANTNAFTDAEKAKVGFVSVTSAIDLDKVVQSDELLTSTTLTGATDTAIPSALAVKTFVEAAATSGGARFAAETLTVTSDKIMLAQKPKDGMILNFGTVRHVDANGVAYDIPVMIDGTDVSGKTYTLLPDSAGQFDTKTVQVQYPYVAA